MALSSCAKSTTVGATLMLGPQLVDCDFVLAQPYVDCGMMDSQMCALRSWIRAGCRKGRECVGEKNVKKCCDGRRLLPFGAGVFYTGYMRACAPGYKLRAGQGPEFARLECNEVESFVCPIGANRYFCDMRNWEKAGCNRRNEQCRHVSGRELAECCAKRPRKPEGFYHDFYLERYTMHCLGE
ncbi:hypothetical protein CDD81_3782 [Ophiocordyceps australis]|uniref:Uncharacterized protein n=1 Tax=Ophiocordyceps australis TaxID=1399860 RepID=A0A2C5Y613_9HYPO|nr:hypothetical protein CDD81_3782 [Ophiocordyceps australis]